MAKITSFLKTLWRKRDGSEVVEFALVAPFVVLLTVGIIDFGRVMWTATTIEHVAREAARYASVHGEGSITVATETSVANFAAGRATGLDQAELNVVVTYEGNNNISGNTVTVEVDYDFVLILGGLLGFDPVALESSSTFTII